MFKVKNSNRNEPFYATQDAAGCDIFSNESGVLDPGEYRLFKTGLFCDLEYNSKFSRIEQQADDGEILVIKAQLEIRPRSGSAFKSGITVLNAPGTIDYMYPGEIGVLLINHGKLPFYVDENKPIAQGVVTCSFELKGVKPGTALRTGGFGSTTKG